MKTLLCEHGSCCFHDYYVLSFTHAIFFWWIYPTMSWWCMPSSLQNLLNSLEVYSLPLSSLLFLYSGHFVIQHRLWTFWRFQRLVIFLVGSKLMSFWCSHQWTGWSICFDHLMEFPLDCIGLYGQAPAASWLAKLFQTGMVVCVVFRAYILRMFHLSLYCW